MVIIFLTVIFFFPLKNWKKIRDHEKWKESKTLEIGLKRMERIECWKAVQPTGWFILPLRIKNLSPQNYPLATFHDDFMEYLFESVHVKRIGGDFYLFQFFSFSCREPYQAYLIIHLEIIENRVCLNSQMKSEKL